MRQGIDLSRQRERREGRDEFTQLGRTWFELNIDTICANSPAAKDRVERAHQTLQDRLVNVSALTCSLPLGINTSVPRQKHGRHALTRMGSLGGYPSSEQLAELIEAAVSRALRSQRAEAPAPLARARLTVTEAAELLRCSPRQVRRLIALGRLRAAKLSQGGSSRVLISRSDIERFLAEAST